MISKVPSERLVKSKRCCCCRLGEICQWRCWRQCWWERFWCSMWGTLRLMMTAVDTCPASRDVSRGELSLCWRQCAGTGVTHCVAGLTHQLVSGSGISWPSSFNVSVYIRHRYTCITDVYYICLDGVYLLILHCKRIFDTAWVFYSLTAFTADEWKWVRA